MRQVEEKFQLRLKEAELESSSQETSDESKPSTETAFDEEESVKESTDLRQDYDE